MSHELTPEECAAATQRERKRDCAMPVICPSHVYSNERESCKSVCDQGSQQQGAEEILLEHKQTFKLEFVWNIGKGVNKRKSFIEPLTEMCSVNKMLCLCAFHQSLWAVHAIKLSISCLFFSPCLINGLHYVLKTAKASLRLSKEPLCGLNYKLKTKTSHFHKQSPLIMLPQHHLVAWLNTSLRVLIKHVFIQILCKLVLRDDTINTPVLGQH